MKPILGIDVDGVILPDGAHAGEPGYNSALHTIFFYDRAGEGWVYLRNDFDLIMKMLMPHFELHWATGWEDRANEFMLPLLGLEDELPYIDLHSPLPFSIIGDLPMEYHWKLPWLMVWADKHERPFAWVDDLVGDGEREWAEKRSAKGFPTLIIQTDNVIGWTSDHTDELIAWAKEVNDE